MSVYQKLTNAREMLQDLNLKKTGVGGKYGSEYKYFELKDFLPYVNKIFNKEKLCSSTIITNELSKMIIYDAEDDSSITFEIPFGNFKGSDKRKLQEVQELGGSVTYLTRYL